MRIGLFGGTFNPVHRCHLEAAAYTRARLRLDRILFIPAGDPPHKAAGSLAPAGHRLRMVQLAIEGHPGLVASDIEMHRATKSYSIDTIHELQKTFGPDAELFFLIGLDAFLELPTWKQAQDLLRVCHFIVLSRPGTAFVSLLKMPLLPAVDRAPLVALDTNRALQVDVSLPAGRRLILLAIPPCLVSASDIRRRVKAGSSVAELLPKAVESYIIDHNLYR